MNNSTYGKGIPYEAFTLRAFKCLERDTKRGTCGSIYEHLIQLEDGTALFKRVSREKQLERVKKWLEKGLNAFLKRKITPEERQVIQILLVRLQSANSSYDLDAIIEQGLNITQPYKHY